MTLAIAELDFGSPEGSEGLRSELPERMEEVPAAPVVPAPLPAALALVSPQPRSTPTVPSPGIAAPARPLLRIIHSSAGPSLAGAGVVSPVVAHASNVSAPAPAFKVCRICLWRSDLMCLAVSSLPHCPSSVRCELLSHPSIRVTVAAGRVSNAFPRCASRLCARRVLCRMCRCLTSLHSHLFRRLCQIMPRICLRLNVLAARRSGAGKLVVQR